MVEGEATQEPTAPEDATTPACARSCCGRDEAARPRRPKTTDATAAEPEAAAMPKRADGAGAAAVAALDWSHLRGFPDRRAGARGAGGAAGLRRANSPRSLPRARRGSRARSTNSIVLSSDGVMRWLGDPVARVVAGDDAACSPARCCSPTMRWRRRTARRSRTAPRCGSPRISARFWGRCWRSAEGVDLPDAARAVAAKIAEALGVLERERVRDEVRALDQTARGALRKLGVRFGALYIYVPLLLKPARARSARCSGRSSAAPRPGPTGCSPSPRRGARRSPTRACCRPTPIASPASGCAASAWCASTSSSA